MTKHTTDTRWAGIYVRISQDRAGAGLGVERQEDECRALAGRLGWTVVEVYSDNDISAFSGRKRPGYERMLADIEAGAINGVIAWHPGRLHRRSLELERYINVCEKYHVENQTVTAGMWDLSTPSGRMTARQLGAVASYESEHKSERLRVARVQQARNGGHHGGIRCFGYEKDGLTVRPDEAGEIAAACKAIARGASVKSVVRDWNTRGVKTVGGKSWTGQQLRQMLIAPRLAGYSAHKGVIVGTAAWPAIVDEAIWRTVEAILSNPARRTNHTTTGAVRWLGSGLYVCGGCQQRNLRVSTSTSSGKPCYRCANRGTGNTKHVIRQAEPLDAWVEELLIERLSRKGTVEKLLRRKDTADVAALRVEQVQLYERKDKLASDWAVGTLDDHQVKVANKAIDDRLAEIAATLAKVGWRSPLEPLAHGDIRKTWARLSLMQKRAILESVVDITVVACKNTRGFNADGVEVNWLIPDR